MFYALIFDPTTGEGLGAHMYAEPPASFPANEMQCTPAQAADPTSWKVSGGAIAASEKGAAATQLAILAAGYAAANMAPISFTTAAGVTDTYQSDPDSVGMLQQTLSGFRSAGKVPNGFYWRSATNQNNAFTYADLEGLVSALVNRGWANFQKWQTLKTQVAAASTVADVQKVVW